MDDLELINTRFGQGLANIYAPYAERFGSGARPFTPVSDEGNRPVIINFNGNVVTDDRFTDELVRRINNAGESGRIDVSGFGRGRVTL